MGDWQDFPLPDGSYSDSTRPWSQQDIVNYLPTFAEAQGARSRLKYATAPGLELFDYVGEGPHRGARDVEGKLFVVSGNKLFQVAPDGTATERGTIPGTGRVSITHNQIDGGNQVVIGSRDNTYVWNTVTNTLTATGVALLSVDFLNQYVLGVDPARRFWRWSGLADALTYSTIDNESAESSPDRIVGGIVSQGEWLVFGERTTEVWSNSPSQDATFVRTVVIERGCRNANTLCRLDNSVFFVDNNGIPCRLQGYSPVPIAPKAIIDEISSCDPTKLSAFTWEDKGYVVYYITAQDGRTWGYDVTSQKWHRRESFGLDRWRLNTLFKWNGDWYGGDYQNGRLYRLSWGYVYEGCEIMPRAIRSGVLHNNGNRVFVHGFKLLARSGGEKSVSACKPCGTAVQYTGGQAVPSTTQIEIGAGTGSLLFRFASGGVPDKAEVYIGGALVLDTGWWGDVSHQTALDAACTAQGITSGTIQAIPTPGISAYAQWNANEAVGFSITKPTSATAATVKVYAPLSNTAWKFQLSCPGAAVDEIDLSGNAPNTSVGAAYSYTYATMGGTAPFTYYLAAGSLPDGLTLDTATGEISGAATTVEAPTFTVGVIDANGLTDTLADQIAVLNVVDWYAVGTGGNGRYGVGTAGTDWSSALGESAPGVGRSHFHVAASATQVLLLDIAAGQVGTAAGGWTECTGLSAQTINAAIHDGAAFLVASNASVIQRSVTGIAFTSYTAPDVPGYGQDNLRCISAKPGLVVACGYWPHTSADGGLTWLSPTTAFVFSGSEKVLAIDNDGTQFIAAGENNRLAGSTNGSSFTAITSPFAGTAHITACCNSGGVWVIGNASGQFAWSLTGASGTWTVSADTLGAEIKKIGGYAGLFVAVGVGGKIMSSLGGASWTNRSNNFGTDTINDVAAFGGAA